MTTQQTFQSFATWAEVIAHVAAGRPIYYHAPLDIRPLRIRARVIGSKNVRVQPPSSDADPFIANRDHLDRFRFLVEV